MLTSIANVPTGAAPRYAKQLAAHLGRKITVDELAGGGFRLAFGEAEGVVEPLPDRLVLRATAPDAATLGQIQDVLGRHLERFGQRAGLTVAWQSVPE